MSRLETGPAVSRSLASLFDDRVSRIKKALSADEPDGEDVHEARKELKKARSLLRLARGRIPGPLYARAQSALRAAGRALSPVRDAEVFARTARSLPLGDDQPALPGAARAGAAAQRARRALQRLPAMKLAFTAVTPEDLAEGVRRTLARARKRAKKAERTRRSADLHEERKAVKAAAEQLASLPKGDDALDELAERLDELGKVLGDEHDLAVACARLRLDHGPRRAVAMASRLDRGLRKRARRLSRDWLDVKPRRVARRVRRVLS